MLEGVNEYVFGDPMIIPSLPERLSLLSLLLGLNTLRQQGGAPSVPRWLMLTERER